MHSKMQESEKVCVHAWACGCIFKNMQESDSVCVFLFCLSLSNPLPLSYLGEVGLYEGDVGEKLCESEGDGGTKKSVQRGTDRPKRECVYVCRVCVSPCRVSRKSIHKHTVHHTYTHSHLGACSLSLCPTHPHVHTCAHTYSLAIFLLSQTFTPCSLTPSLSFTSAKSDCMKATLVNSCGGREQEIDTDTKTQTQRHRHKER